MCHRVSVYLYHRKLYFSLIIVQIIYTIVNEHSYYSMTKIIIITKRIQREGSSNLIVIQV